VVCALFCARPTVRRGNQNCNDRDDEHGPKNHQAEIVLPVPADAALTAGRKQRVQIVLALNVKKKNGALSVNRCDLKG